MEKSSKRRSVMSYVPQIMKDFSQSPENICCQPKKKHSSNALKSKIKNFESSYNFKRLSCEKNKINLLMNSSDNLNSNTNSNLIPPSSLVVPNEKEKMIESFPSRSSINLEREPLRLSQAEKDIKMKLMSLRLIHENSEDTDVSMNLNENEFITQNKRISLPMIGRPRKINNRFKNYTGDIYKNKFNYNYFYKSNINGSNINNYNYGSSPSHKKEKKSSPNFQSNISTNGESGYLVNLNDNINKNDGNHPVNNNNVNSLNTNRNKKLIAEIKNRRLIHTLNVYDSLDDNEDLNEDEETFECFPPNCFFFQFLDSLLIFFCLYLLLFYPLNMVKKKCFCYKNEKLFNLSLNYITELLFIIDLLSSLVKGYYDYEYKLILNCKKVLINYLKTDFFFDLFEALPIYAISRKICKNNRDDEFCQIPFNNKLIWLRILSLLKSFKIYKIMKNKNSILEKITMILSENIFIENTVNFIIDILMCFLFMHNFICLHIFLGQQNYPNWILLSRTENKNFISQYIASFYFIICTMTTVGYGDIVCVSFMERIYQIILLAIGVVLYSFIISKFGNYIKNESHAQIKLNNDESLLEEIRVAYPAMPFKLYYKIHRHLINTSRKAKKFEISELINSLPEQIRNSLLFVIYDKVINNFNIFKGCENSNFILKVLTSFIPIISKKEDFLILEGESIDNIFFVKDGRLALLALINFDDPFVSIRKYFDVNFVGISRHEEKKVKMGIFDTSRGGMTMRYGMGDTNQNYDEMKNILSEIIEGNPRNNQFTTRPSSINEEDFSKEVGNLDCAKNGLYNEEDDKNKGNFEYIKILDVRKNEHFGDVIMFLNRLSPLTLQVKSKIAELFVLRKRDAHLISKEYSNIWKRIQNKSFHNLVSIKKITFQKLESYYNVNLLAKDKRMSIFSKKTIDQTDISTGSLPFSLRQNTLASQRGDPVLAQMTNISRQVSSNKNMNMNMNMGVNMGMNLNLNMNNIRNMENMYPQAKYRNSVWKISPRKKRNSEAFLYNNIRLSRIGYSFERKISNQSSNLNLGVVNQKFRNRARPSFFSIQKKPPRAFLGHTLSIQNLRSLKSVKTSDKGLGGVVNGEQNRIVTVKTLKYNKGRNRPQRYDGNSMIVIDNNNYGSAVARGFGFINNINTIKTINTVKTLKTLKTMKTRVNKNNKKNGKNIINNNNNIKNVNNKKNENESIQGLTDKRKSKKNRKNSHNMKDLSSNSYITDNNDKSNENNDGTSSLFNQKSEKKDKSNSNSKSSNDSISNSNSNINSNRSNRKKKDKKNKTKDKEKENENNKTNEKLTKKKSKESRGTEIIIHKSNQTDKEKEKDKESSKSSRSCGIKGTIRIGPTSINNQLFIVHKKNKNKTEEKINNNNNKIIDNLLTLEDLSANFSKKIKKKLKLDTKKTKIKKLWRLLKRKEQNTNTTNYIFNTSGTCNQINLNLNPSRKLSKQDILSNFFNYNLNNNNTNNNNHNISNNNNPHIHKISNTHILSKILDSSSLSESEESKENISSPKKENPKFPKRFENNSLTFSSSESFEISGSYLNLNILTQGRIVDSGKVRDEIEILIKNYINGGFKAWDKFATINTLNNQNNNLQMILGNEQNLQQIVEVNNNEQIAQELQLQAQAKAEKQRLSRLKKSTISGTKVFKSRNKIKNTKTNYEIPRKSFYFMRAEKNRNSNILPGIEEEVNTNDNTTINTNNIYTIRNKDKKKKMSIKIPKINLNKLKSIRVSNSGTTINKNFGILFGKDKDKDKDKEKNESINSKNMLSSQKNTIVPRLTKKRESKFFKESEKNETKIEMKSGYSLIKSNEKSSFTTGLQPFPEFHNKLRNNLNDDNKK